MWVAGPKERKVAGIQLQEKRREAERSGAMGYDVIRCDTMQV
jgi:hypothetical protein